MYVRPFTVEDARRVSYLLKKTILHSFPSCYEQHIIDAFVKHNTPKWVLHRARTRTYYLAFINDKLVGINGLKENEIKTMFVNPSYHGRGVGKALMLHAEKIAKKKKCKELIVYSSPIAEMFYKKMGFKKVKNSMRTIDNISFANVFMKKRI